LVASTVASEWRTHRPNLWFVKGWFAMGPTLALSSSDGRFSVSLAGDDVELVASMLLLLEMSLETTGGVEHISRWRQWRDHADDVPGLARPAPAA